MQGHLFDIFGLGLKDSWAITHWGSQGHKVVVRKILKRKAKGTGQQEENAKKKESPETSKWDAGGYSQWREEAPEYWNNWAWPPHSDWKPWSGSYDYSWNGDSYRSPGSKEGDGAFNTPEPTRRTDSAQKLMSQASTSSLEVAEVHDQLKRCNSGDQMSFAYRLQQAEEETKNNQDAKTQAPQDHGFWEAAPFHQQHFYWKCIYTSTWTILHAAQISGSSIYFCTLLLEV